MARLLTLITMLVTLHLGGASALHQDAVDAFHYTHSGLNSLSSQVTSELVNLHNNMQSNGS